MATVFRSLNSVFVRLAKRNQPNCFINFGILKVTSFPDQLLACFLFGFVYTLHNMSQLFSLAEVSEYNGENGKACWIIIRDIVYDVTNYLDDVSDFYER